ncbi:MAG TPA: hypothetical protein DEA50_13530 [Parvularcula sp.]|nr:hypothetical protein [Parvularcula sp.]
MRAHTSSATPYNSKTRPPTRRGRRFAAPVRSGGFADRTGSEAARLIVGARIAVRLESVAQRRNRRGAGRPCGHRRRGAVEFTDADLQGAAAPRPAACFEFERRRRRSDGARTLVVDAAVEIAHTALRSAPPPGADTPARKKTIAGAGSPAGPRPS